mgnify:CR=1 FL=1
MATSTAALLQGALTGHGVFGSASPLRRSMVYSRRSVMTPSTLSVAMSDEQIFHSLEQLSHVPVAALTVSSAHEPMISGLVVSSRISANTSWSARLPDSSFASYLKRYVERLSKLTAEASLPTSSFFGTPSSFTRKTRVSTAMLPSWWSVAEADGILQFVGLVLLSTPPAGQRSVKSWRDLTFVPSGCA